MELIDALWLALAFSAGVCIGLILGLGRKGNPHEQALRDATVPPMREEDIDD